MGRTPFILLLAFLFIIVSLVIVLVLINKSFTRLFSNKFPFTPQQITEVQKNKHIINLYNEINVELPLDIFALVIYLIYLYDDRNYKDLSKFLKRLYKSYAICFDSMGWFFFIDCLMEFLKVKISDEEAREIHRRGYTLDRLMAVVLELYEMKG